MIYIYIFSALILPLLFFMYRLFKDLIQNPISGKSKLVSDYEKIIQIIPTNNKYNELKEYLHTNQLKLSLEKKISTSRKFYRNYGFILTISIGFFVTYFLSLYLDYCIQFKTNIYYENKPLLIFIIFIQVIIITLMLNVLLYLISTHDVEVYKENIELIHLYKKLYPDTLTLQQQKAKLKLESKVRLNSRLEANHSSNNIFKRLIYWAEQTLITIEKSKFSRWFKFNHSNIYYLLI